MQGPQVSIPTVIKVWIWIHGLWSKKNCPPTSCALALKLALERLLQVLLCEGGTRLVEYNSKGDFEKPAWWWTPGIGSPLVRVTGFPSVNQHPGHFSPSVRADLQNLFLVNIKTLIKAHQLPENSPAAHLLCWPLCYFFPFLPSWGSRLRPSCWTASVVSISRIG